MRKEKINKKNKKGFTMAELLLALLVISIVISASMPTVVRTAKAEREQIWRWFNINTAITFGKNSSQKVLIGLSATPDSDIVNGNHASDTPQGPLPDGVIMPVLNGKVSIIKPGGIQNSHIDMFVNSGSNLQYAGRISACPSNIAIGTGVLQSTAAGNNTGVGNYALYTNEGGENNTALGYSALRSNFTGSNNTAAGSRAVHAITDGNGNTLLGNEAASSYGTDANGNQTFEGLKTGNRNTFIGAKACSDILDTASGSICIGYNVPASNIYNTKTGLIEQNNDMLIIGSNTTDSTDYYPLVTGHLRNTDSYDKDIDFNVSYFNINTYDGERTVFETAVLRNAYNSANPYDASYSNYFTDARMKYYFRTNDSSYPQKYTGIRFELGEGVSGSTTGYYGVGINIKNYRNYNEGWYTSGSDPEVLSINDDDLVLTFKSNNGDTTQFNHSAELSTPTLMTLESGNDTTGSSSLILSANGLGLQSNPTSGNPSLFILNGEKEFDINGNDGNVNLKGKTVDLSIFNNSESKNIEFETPSDKLLNINPELRIGGNDNIIINGNNPSISLYDDDGTKTAELQSNGSIYFYYLLKIGDFRKKSYGSIIGQGQTRSISNQYTKLYEHIEYAENLCSLCASSDIRLKNVKGDFKGGIKEIEKLKVKNYTYKNDKKQEPHVGVIAQELKKIFPSAVLKCKKSGYLYIRTEDIFYASVNAVKELYSKFLDLTAKSTGLDKRLEELKKENKELKAKSKEFERRLDSLEKEQLDM